MKRAPMTELCFEAELAGASATFHARELQKAIDMHWPDDYIRHRAALERVAADLKDVLDALPDGATMRELM